MGVNNYTFPVVWSAMSGINMPKISEANMYARYEQMLRRRPVAPLQHFHIKYTVEYLEYRVVHTELNSIQFHLKLLSLTDRQASQVL